VEAANASVDLAWHHFPSPLSKLAKLSSEGSSDCGLTVTDHDNHPIDSHQTATKAYAATAHERPSRRPSSSSPSSSSEPVPPSSRPPPFSSLDLPPPFSQFPPNRAAREEQQVESLENVDLASSDPALTVSAEADGEAALSQDTKGASSRRGSSFARYKRCIIKARQCRRERTTTTLRRRIKSHTRVLVLNGGRRWSCKSHNTGAAGRTCSCEQSWR